MGSLAFAGEDQRPPSYQCSTRDLLAYNDDVKTLVSKSLASSGEEGRGTRGRAREQNT
jgi:hypothetical protein